MKELSIEEKAARYDKAIEKLRSLHDDYDTVSTLIDIKEELEQIFPELKESEDEKIRKTIYNCVKWFGFDSCFFKNVSQEKCLAWLKKQGEPFTKKDVDDAYLKGVCDAKSELEKQGEQNPAWSEEDERMCNISIRGCKCVIDNFENSTWDYEDAIAWLKSLKERVQLQPKQEWSEDTQQWIDAIIKDYEEWYDINKDHKATIQVKINILKSLKERYTWKPSDEQLNALDEVYKTHGANSVCRRIIFNLLEQLKKL